MAAFFIGNFGGNADANAGTGVIIVPFFIDWFDQGEFGFAPPFNSKIKINVVLTGNVRITRRGPFPTNLTFTVVLGTQIVSGNLLRVHAIVTNKAIPVTFFLVGRTGLVLFLRESIIFATFLGGALKLSTYPMLTREFFALRDGVRPTFPWLIYVKDLTHYSQIKVGSSTFNQPLEKPFLLSANIDPATDPILTSLGGKPNWIGMVVEEPVNGVPVRSVRFREPEPFEVVVYVPTCQVLRWEATKWVEYSTLPERAMNGQLVLQLFDPEGIYEYYAKMLGLVLAEWQYDTEHLRSFIDPISCPDAYVSLLADNFGLSISGDTPVDQKREFIRQFVQLQKEKGTDQSIRDALGVLGYQGYATHVWVIPGGTSSDYIERPLGYDNEPPSTYFPASQVAIHLNDLDGEPLTVIDDGVRADVADFLMRNILPAHIRIRFFSTDIPVAAAAEGAAVSDALVITDI